MAMRAKNTNDRDCWKYIAHKQKGKGPTDKTSRIGPKKFGGGLPLARSNKKESAGPKVQSHRIGDLMIHADASLLQSSALLLSYRRD
jgi:hypothetical protein